MDMTRDDQVGLADVRWAPRVNPSAIRCLYEAGARGVVDEELIDEVGNALEARCRSIVRATEAHHGRITCPRCGHPVTRQSGAWEQDTPVACAHCGWRVRWGAYPKTYQGKHLAAGGAEPQVRAFVERFERARTPRDKMLAIDAVLHAFHWELASNPGRSSARELIYARNNVELLTFLDRLAYGDGSTPGLRERKQAWDEKLERSAWHRMTGFRPRAPHGPSGR